MSADIKQLRTRIKSVNSTLHLTKAMGLVASSKIRRATESMIKGNEYAEAFNEVAEQLSSYEDCRNNPYMKKRTGDIIRLVVIAGDRGLAGGYNANIFRLMREYQNAEIIAVGKRACEKYGGKYVSAEKFSFSDAMNIANEVCSDFVGGKIDKFGIVCTKYISLMSQEAEVRWVLPLDRKSEKLKTESAIFEPDAETVLNAVVPEYVSGMIVSCVKESFACEIAARRVAMDNADKNAQEMLERLGLEYNRARQGAITQEITEIVAGSGI